MRLHAVAHATWHTYECPWWHDIGHDHANHSLAAACCCMRLHILTGHTECLWWHDIGHGHTIHSLTVACCCMQLHMQPGTLASACGGMTSVMATPITAWLWHAVACGCACNLGTLGYLWWHDIGRDHTNHSLAVTCSCMRLHMQPGTLVIARGGMTSVMTTPITA